MPIKTIIEVILTIFNTNPLKVLSRQRIILGVILLLGIGLLLFKSLLYPQLIELKIIRPCFSSQKKLCAYQQKIIKDPQIFSAKIGEKKEKLNSLEKKFITEQEAVQFFNDLKNLVIKTENQLLSLDIKPSVAIGAYQKLPFSISLKGYYVDVILLLDKFERYPRLIQIKDANIQPTAEKSYEVMMNLEAELFVAK